MSEDDPRIKAIEPFKWKKGQSGNPKGLKPIPQDIKALMKEKSNEYRRKFLYWIDAPIEDIKKCKAEWPATGLDQMICSAIITAMNGDTKAMDAVLDRILGKAKQDIDITTQDNTLINLVEKFQSMPDEDLLKQAFLAHQKLKGTIDVTTESREATEIQHTRSTNRRPALPNNPNSTKDSGAD